MAVNDKFSIGKIRFGAGAPLFLIAGPCVIESESHAMMMAEKLAAAAAELGVPYIFKASYDKANRSSVSSFRGPGLKKGLSILAKIKKRRGSSDPDRRSRGLACRSGRRSLRHSSSPGFSFAPNGFSGRRGKIGTHRQSEKGPVPFALGNEKRRRESRQHGKRKNHSHRTRRILRLSESCRGHALLSRSCASLAIPLFSM